MMFSEFPQVMMFYETFRTSMDNRDHVGDTHARERISGPTGAIVIVDFSSKILKWSDHKRAKKLRGSASGYTEAQIGTRQTKTREGQTKIPSPESEPEPLLTRAKRVKLAI